MMSMQMTFYQSCQSTILFDAWETTTCGEYWLSILAVAFMGMARQLIVALRRNFRAAVTQAKRKAAKSMSLTGATAGSADECCSASVSGYFKDGTARPKTWGQWAVTTPSVVAGIDGFLSFVAVSAAFLNMLITMTYNGGLFIGVCVGEALGVVAFDPALVLCGCQQVFAASDGQMAACH